MNHQQQGVVYGYSEVTVVSTAGPPPYYPPPPPPPPPPRRRLSLCRILIGAIVSACVFIGVVSLLIWLIYRPQSMQVAVATATLARFDLNTTSPIPVLFYNLTAVLAVTNPNRRVSIYYDQLQAVGFYQDQRFGHAALPVSFQGTRHADDVPAVLAGSSAAVEVSADEFREDSGAGGVPRRPVGGRRRAVQVRRADYHHGDHDDGQVPSGAEADGGVGVGPVYRDQLLIGKMVKARRQLGPLS